MDSLKIFLKTYWQHARSIFDFIIFAVSFIAIFFGIQTPYVPPVAATLIIVVIIVAMYRTWLYQYRLTEDLIASQDKAVAFNDLNDIQKAILQGMSGEQEKRIIVSARMGGLIFRGIGDTDQNYDDGEIEAEISELVKLDVLRLSGYSSRHSNPIYKLTSHGYKILKELQISR